MDAATYGTHVAVIAMNAIAAAAPCTRLHPATCLDERLRGVTLVAHEDMNARLALDLTATTPL
jgi:hypothetical protein